MNPSNVKYYVRELLKYDLVKQLGGSRYRGYEYEVVKMEDYKELQDSLSDCLKTILLKIKGLSG